MSSTDNLPLATPMLLYWTLSAEVDWLELEDKLDIGIAVM